MNDERCADIFAFDTGLTKIKKEHTLYDYEITGPVHTWLDIMMRKVDVKQLNLAPMFEEWKTTILSIRHESKTFARHSNQGTAYTYEDTIYYETKSSPIVVFTGEWMWNGTMYDFSDDAKNQAQDQNRFTLRTNFITSWLFDPEIVIRKEARKNFVETCSTLDPKWHFGLFLLTFKHELLWEQSEKCMASLVEVGKMCCIC